MKKDVKDDYVGDVVAHQVDVAYHLGLKVNNKVRSLSKLIMDNFLIIVGFFVACCFFLYGFLNFRSKKKDK